MHTVSDHEHAPYFVVRYFIPSHKAPQDGPRDQAHKLRAMVPQVAATGEKRVAGKFQAWTGSEAVSAARRAGMIPGTAFAIDAEECKSEEEQPALF